MVCSKSRNVVLLKLRNGGEFEEKENEKENAADKDKDQEMI
jgi:hypothetical protein